jgi:TatD DNase family protein
VYVDAHNHLDDDSFDADRDAVFERARAAGVTGFVLGGVNPATWKRQRALAAAHPRVVWTAGLHPHACARLDDAAARAALDALPACFEGEHAARGLGETGLDTHFCAKDTLDRQLRLFREQLALARRLDRPVVLHVVGGGTHSRVLETLRDDGAPRAGGMVHMYGGSSELVREYVALGLCLSFGGPVANPNARRLRKAAAEVPADRLLVETDAPDLPPPDFEPEFGARPGARAAGGGRPRNEPASLPLVAKALAALRDEPADVILARAAERTRALFGAPPPCT